MIGLLGNLRGQEGRGISVSGQRGSDEIQRQAYVHMNFSSEELSGRRMQQKHALDQVEGLDDEQVICTIATFPQEPLETADQSHSNVPLEAQLQFIKFSKGRVLVDVIELLRRRGWR